MCVSRHENAMLRGSVAAAMTIFPFMEISEAFFRENVSTQFLIFIIYCLNFSPLNLLTSNLFREDI